MVKFCHKGNAGVMTWDGYLFSFHWLSKRWKVGWIMNAFRWSSGLSVGSKGRELGIRWRAVCGSFLKELRFLIELLIKSRRENSGRRKVGRNHGWLGQASGGEGFPQCQSARIGGCEGKMRVEMMVWEGAQAGRRRRRRQLSDLGRWEKM